MDDDLLGFSAFVSASPSLTLRHGLSSPPSMAIWHRKKKKIPTVENIDGFKGAVVKDPDPHGIALFWVAGSKTK